MKFARQYVLNVPGGRSGDKSQTIDNRVPSQFWSRRWAVRDPVRDRCCPSRNECEREAELLVVVQAEEKARRSGPIDTFGILYVSYVNAVAY